MQKDEGGRREPNRNQSRAYVTDHVGGPPPARRVVLPAAWEGLQARHG
jgi:hypothetical protein